jgi:hypothetical protein
MPIATAFKSGRRKLAVEAGKKKIMKPKVETKKEKAMSIFEEGLPSNFRDHDMKRRQVLRRLKTRTAKNAVLALLQTETECLARRNPAGAPKKGWDELTLSRKQVLVREMRKGFDGKLRQVSKQFMSELHRSEVHSLRVKYDVILKSGDVLEGGFEIRKEKKDYDFEKIRVCRVSKATTVSKEMKKEQKKKKGFQVLAELAKSSVSKRVLQDILWAADGELKACFLDKLQSGIDEEMRGKLPTYPIAEGVDGRWVDPTVLVELVFPSLKKKVNYPTWFVVVFSGDGRKSGKTHGVLLSLKLIVGNTRGNSVSAVYPIAISRGTEKYANLVMMMEKLHKPLQVFYNFVMERERERGGRREKEGKKKEEVSSCYVVRRW